MRKTAAAALASSLALLAACHGAGGDPSPSRAPQGETWLSKKQVEDARIVVEPAVERDVGAAIVTSGRVAFDDTRVAHVASPVTGRIERILAPLGARVARGDPLAEIVSPDVGQAASDLSKAEADLSAARAEHERQRELFEAHAGAQRDLEAAESAFRKAEAERDRAREKARLLGAPAGAAVSQKFLLRAPIAGEIVARNVNPGTEVQGQCSGGGAVELFTVGELDRVWILADAYEADLPRIRRGAAVTVTVVSYPGKLFPGNVDWIAGAFDPATRTAKVRCVIGNPGRELRPEMFATVSIVVDGRRALAVPRSAVLRLGDRTVVFVEAGTAPGGLLRFERRPVTVDEEGSGDYVAVTGGLSAGEKVVTVNAILLAGTS